MKKYIILFFCVFAVALNINAQDISSALRQAQARFDSGNETGAIELVNKVLEKYPDNEEAKDLLSKFNQVITDREIEVDWKIAQTEDTFESYHQFRTKHPVSKYDDTASDTMARRLADKFTSASTYSDRTKAESYAKKAMTKDYVANKWKAAMAKKPTSSSSYGSSGSSSTSYNSSSSSSRTTHYGTSSYGSSSASSSSSSGSRSYNSERPIPDKRKFAIGIEGSIEGLKSLSTGWGVSMRIGAFNSLFNLTIGAKYQYTMYTKWVSYSYNDYDGSGRFDYNYVSGNADYKHRANQMVFPINVNWNLSRKSTFAYYIGVGYEHGLLISESKSFKNKSYDFSESDFWDSSEPDNIVQLSVPSRSVVIQMGFAGRHWDWKMYYKIYANKSAFYNGDPGAIGTSFTYYF